MIGNWVIKFSFVFAMTGHGIDLSSTQRCIGANVCRELNPFLARFENPIGFATAKMVVAGSTEVVIYDFSKDNRPIAIITNIAIGSVFTGLGIRNWNKTKNVRN